MSGHDAWWLKKNALAAVGTLGSPMLAFSGRPGVALGLFGAPWAYCYYEWRNRVSEK